MVIYRLYGNLLFGDLTGHRMGENTGQKKLRIWTLFMQWSMVMIIVIP